MSAPARHRMALYWAAACGGCDIAVLNLGEALMDLEARVELVFWPAVMDVKLSNLEAMPDGSIDVTLFNGGIRTDEHAAMARLLRRRSRLLVALGSCATEGCIPGLANLRPVEDLLSAVFDGPVTDNPDHLRPAAEWSTPDGALHLPMLQPTLGPLGSVVDVDIHVPGCPPETERIADVVGHLLAALDGAVPLPPAGAVLGAGRSTVCDECRRTRGEKHITRFERIQTLAQVDPTLCLLEQGLPCNGPATRDGCGARCPAAGAPCIGCYGPTEGVIDGGARLLSAFASVIDASEPEDIELVLDGLPDPVGQFYRFGLAGSLLGAARGVRGDRGESTVGDRGPSPRQDRAAPPRGDRAAPARGDRATPPVLERAR